MSAFKIFSCKEGQENLPDINLNDLNESITYIHFKIRGSASLSVSSMSGDLICRIEIHLAQKSTYYVSFQWMGLFYSYCCLYFGLSSALKASTKLMKVPIPLLKRFCVRIITYLDNLLYMEAS